MGIQPPPDPHRWVPVRVGPGFSGRAGLLGEPRSRDRRRQPTWHLRDALDRHRQRGGCPGRLQGDGGGQVREGHRGQRVVGQVRGDDVLPVQEMAWCRRLRHDERDDSFPPPIIDRQFMGPAHEQLDAALRNQVRDSRHIYFQEPSGWSYWGAQFTRIPGPTGLMNGVDIGDPNRVFCPKWLANGDSSSDLATDGLMAAQSNAPLFICELWITKTGSDGTTIDQQRAALNAMDRRLVGGARYMYTPDASNGALTHDGHAAPWLPQYARPYPEWAGGTIKSIGYDFGARKLVVGLGLSGSGPTEVYVGYPGTYPNGFVASSSSGARLVYDGHRVVRASRMSWDAKRRRVVLPPQRQSVTFTLQPR